MTEINADIKRSKRVQRILWFGVFPALFLIAGIFLYFKEFTPAYLKFSYVLVYFIGWVLYFPFMLLNRRNF